MLWQEQVLRDTGIGCEVNHKFLRAHADATVRERSRDLIHSWKALVPAKASSPPEVATAAAPAPAAAAPTPAAEGQEPAAPSAASPSNGKEEDPDKNSGSPAQEPAAKRNKTSGASRAANARAGDGRLAGRRSA